MCVFKWLKSFTLDLFVTAERPIVLIVNQAKNEDFSSHVCRLLTLWGADVVHLIDLYPKDFYCFNYYDCVIFIEEIYNRVTLVLNKPHCSPNKKTAKKTFSQKDFDLAKYYI